jgi:hypothetical protein
MTALGQNSRSDRMNDLKFKKFYNKLILFDDDDNPSVIKNIRQWTVSSDYEKGDRKLLISIERSGVQEGRIIYNITTDKYESIYDIDLKGAKIFSSIAQMCNKNTRYARRQEHLK